MIDSAAQRCLACSHGSCPDCTAQQAPEHDLCTSDRHACEGPTATAALLSSAEEANALPIGSVIVMHHKDTEPVPHPGCTWFRIERGWINSFGSEVPARPDWPHIGVLGGPSAVTVAFRAEVKP